MSPTLKPLLSVGAGVHPESESVITIDEPVMASNACACGSVSGETFFSSKVYITVSGERPLNGLADFVAGRLGRATWRLNVAEPVTGWVMGGLVLSVAVAFVAVVAVTSSVASRLAARDHVLR